MNYNLKYLFVIIISIFFFPGCDTGEDSQKINKADWQTLEVSASAYNSVSYQTEHNPKITAWGDTLKANMKVIAVSRDLIRKGLKYNTPVRIEGLEGIYFVKDKMHYRWKNKIDIYMGDNVQLAKDWGRKKVNIHYLNPTMPDSLVVSK